MKTSVVLLAAITVVQLGSVLVVASSVIAAEGDGIAPIRVRLLHERDWWMQDDRWLRTVPADVQNSHRIQVINAEGPRAYLYKQFLSKEEADHVIDLAQGSFERSTVVDPSGDANANSVRTSSDVSIRRGYDAIVAAIEQRIASWTGAPVDHGERMVVLRYEVGQEYQPHYDYFFDLDSVAEFGQRVATVIMYLSDDYQGGETVFPMTLDNGSGIMPDSSELSDCARQQGLAVKAGKGDALLFLSVLPDGNNMDELSLHASCPVLSGNKFVATKWLRTNFVRG